MMVHHIFSFSLAHKEEGLLINICTFIKTSLSYGVPRCCIKDACIIYENVNWTILLI